MDCKDILEMFYEDDSIFTGARVWIHTLFCESCAKRVEIYKAAREVMCNDFFPDPALYANTQDIEESVMAKIASENPKEEADSVSGILSTRYWVIAGLVIFLSFVTAYMGLDFKNIADETGTSFILPVGIVFGIVLTLYCVMFISSHLKEFTKRFL